MYLDFAGMKNYWSMETDELNLCIADGMPYEKTSSGNYVFDTEKCEKWWREGWFDSLPKHAQWARKARLKGIDGLDKSQKKGGK